MLPKWVSKWWKVWAWLVFSIKKRIDMNAIVPLNIAALRVSPTDNSNVVTQFKGRVAFFDNMPYGKKSSLTSTGDAIVDLPENSTGPQASLSTGIHLHWELPDYFRQGVQQPGASQIVFPQAPNRWLVIRYLSLFDTNTNTWGAPASHSWIVESDYISTAQLSDPAPDNNFIRPSVPVPLPVNPAFGEQPFRFMGRVVDAADWKQNGDGKYLGDFNDVDGKPCYLNSIGFLGPGFAAYYPDCCTVFGFLDRFADMPVVYKALTGVTPIQFKVSYQVMGWIQNGPDPLDGMGDEVTKQYNTYVAQCRQQKTDIKQTPADFFCSMAKSKFKWLFNKENISFTVNDGAITSLNLPGKTICAGMMEEVVWNMLVQPGANSFLGDPTTKTKYGMWTDSDVKIAVGNTSSEALSALLKFDNDNHDNDPDLLNNYEYLLNALQLGILKDMEVQGNNVIALEEALHSNGFAREQGGQLWIVQPKPKDPMAPVGPANPSAEITLPLTLAEELNQLNQAQKNYDMGRSALDTTRKQLFMDWYRYIKMYAGGAVSNNVSLTTLTNFLSTSGALGSVVNQGNATGILSYISATDGSGAITGINQPVGMVTSLANKLWDAWKSFQVAMKKYPAWQVIAVAAPSFWQPTDPVAVIEGSRMEPVRRNGDTSEIAVRLSTELLNQLSITFNGKTFLVNPGGAAGLPVINGASPYATDCQALVTEAALLIPTLAVITANVLKAQGGGADNPAIADYTAFVSSLTLAQGGVSGLEGGSPATGLYNAIRQPKYIAVANPVQDVNGPQALSVTFSNTAQDGWAPNAVGWSTQLRLPEFSNNRYDPFLPVTLIWDILLDPLKKNAGSNYDAANITNFFQLDNHAIDYGYNTAGPSFNTGNPGEYASSVVMSKKATYSLSYQINNYEQNYPGDDADKTLSTIAADYQNRKILSQTMSGLNVSQLQRNYIPQITVEDLTVGNRDTVTNNIKEAALTANAGDNWYDFAFNSQNPLTSGVFGPLRGGFMNVKSLEVVDVFGQRMKIDTPEHTKEGYLKVLPAMTMAPQPGDTANSERVYLPPRLLAPARLWYRWLSATHNNEVAGIVTDFVEMNAHPATSPVCGWVLPNHLDDNLFFYNADGVAIGSFGMEHGNLQYRTRAGNLKNPADSLTVDIGAAGKPLDAVNEHLANFMWFINNRSGAVDGKGGSDAFLSATMQAILNSDQYINPANFAQDASLAVLVGRPLAITRAVISMETAGNLLPLTQADTAPTDGWPTDINNDHVNYTDRMKDAAADLAAIQFPLRMGDLSNIDDGLVGYIIEGNGSDPYLNGTFYAPAATKPLAPGIAVPASNTITLTLNAAPVVLTMLIDPRAAVHATTGVLPVEELSIPADQYSNTLANMEVTFFTMPVLQQQLGLNVPLPAQSGYVWGWVNPGAADAIPLAANAVSSNAVWGYSPQTLLEGWLELSPDPNKAPPPPVTKPK
jgi:hypothetical protein